MKHTIIAALVASLMMNAASPSARPPQDQGDCTFAYALPLQKQRIERFDLDMAYVEAGEGEQTLLLVHGLGGYIGHWDRNLEALSAKTHVVAVDLPGYGMSTKREFPEAKEDCMQFFAEALAAFVETKGLENVTLVGHSMGGQTAIVATLAFPKKFERLALLAPAGLEDFSPQEGMMIRAAVSLDVVKNKSESDVRRDLAFNFYRMPEAAEKLYDDRVRAGDCPEFGAYCQTVVNGMDGMLKHAVKPDLGKLTQPTLVLLAANDNLIPNKFLHPNMAVSEIEATARLIPGAQVETLPEVGHLLQYEQPEAVNERLLAFLGL